MDDEPELPFDTPDEQEDTQPSQPRPLEMQVCIGDCKVCPLCDGS